MKRKILHILTLLAAVLLFSALALCVSAEDRTPVASGNAGEGVEWQIYNLRTEKAPYYKLVFTGSGSIIGLKSDGTPISYSTQGKSQFAPYRDNIYEVSVGEGITSIGSFGLAFLYEVRFVELAESTAALGNTALESCQNLIKLYRRGENKILGLNLTGITSLGAYTFDGCKSIKYVLFDESFSGVIDTECFKSLAEAEVIKIPAGVTAIKKNAFYGCQSLKTIIFEGDPTTDEKAFDYCGKLEKIYCKKGGKVEAYAKKNGIPVGYDIPAGAAESPFYDENAIDTGNLGEGVYYKIIPENDSYTLYAFAVGKGDTTRQEVISGKYEGYSLNHLSQISRYSKTVTKAVIGDGITSIGSGTFNGMTSLREIEIHEGVKNFGFAAFEAATSLETIYVRGNEPIRYHIDLTHGEKFDSYLFDGCKKIKTVAFPEKTKSDTLGTELFKNCVSLEKVNIPMNTTSVGARAFLGCKSLKSLSFYRDVTIAADSFDGSGLTSLSAPRNSNIEKYASENGITFIAPNIISVYSGDTLVYKGDIISGYPLSESFFADKCMLLYRDGEMTVPFDYSERIYEDMTLYGREIVSHVGFMVRKEDYHGLRSIYELYPDAVKGNDMYIVEEVGAIASRERGLRGECDFDTESSHIYKYAVAKNGEICGKFCSVPNGRSAKFAFTSTGYEKNPALEGKNITETLYFRGYVIIKNRESGETYEFLTPARGISLKEAAEKTLVTENTLTEAEKSFIRSASNCDFDRNRIFSKAEVIKYLEAEYKNPQSLLYGQHIDVGTPDAFANFMARFKDETGNYPAVVGIDQGTMNRGTIADETKPILINDLIEYAKRGGIISMSFHMDNPTDESLYCRGSLGGADAWNELMTSGTKLNASLMRSLETARDTLKTLEEAGVPVLWRPLHECNGGWFWWCTVQDGKVLDASCVKRLWQYFYNYLEVECGLTNLIWVYSPNYTTNTSTTSGTQLCTYNYPGDDYVDIVGCDWYTGTGKASDLFGAANSYPSMVSTGKIAALTEFGPSGTLLPQNSELLHPFTALDELRLMKDVIAEGYSITYVLNWTAHWGILDMTEADAFMADPLIKGTNESYKDFIKLLK